MQRIRETLVVAQLERAEEERRRMERAREERLRNKELATRHASQMRVQAILDSIALRLTQQTMVLASAPVRLPLCSYGDLSLFTNACLGEGASKTSSSSTISVLSHQWFCLKEAE